MPAALGLTDWVAPLLLGLLGVEAAGLLWLWRARRAGVAPGALLPMLGAGAGLAAAAWAAPHAPFLAAALLGGAGACHVADLRRRWRSD